MNETYKLTSNISTFEETKFSYYIPPPPHALATIPIWHHFQAEFKSKFRERANLYEVVTVSSGKWLEFALILKHLTKY